MRVPNIIYNPPKKGRVVINHLQCAAYHNCNNTQGATAGGDINLTNF